MNIVNVELYSIVILFILLMDYIFKFHKEFNVASLLWLLLNISTIFVSLGNLLLTFSQIYAIKLVAIVIYLLGTLISSLLVYVYIKYTYINSKISIKKEFIHLLISIFICIIVTLIYVFSVNSHYVMHSFDRQFFNKLLTLAIIPNISISIMYIIHVIKNKILINSKILIVLMITIIGLISDIFFDTLFFVSATFTLTTLIIYINKHEQLLNTDPLTGLTNKRGLEAFLINLRRDLTIAVYNIDIDKFKNVNDTYGHSSGDDVLKTVADMLKDASRFSDLVIRNGGDEFLIIAEIRKKDDAIRLIDRINKLLDMYNEHAKIKINLSIGWGIYKSSVNNTIDDFSKFLNKIDKKMYKQKKTKYKIDN